MCVSYGPGTNIHLSFDIDILLLTCVDVRSVEAQFSIFFLHLGKFRSMLNEIGTIEKKIVLVK